MQAAALGRHISHGVISCHENKQAYDGRVRSCSSWARELTIVLANMTSLGSGERHGLFDSSIEHWLKLRKCAGGYST